MDPLDSSLTTELRTVLLYQKSTPYHSSVNYLTRQVAESSLQGWTESIDGTLLGLRRQTSGREPYLPSTDSLHIQ